MKRLQIIALFIFLGSLLLWAGSWLGPRHETHDHFGAAFTPDAAHAEQQQYTCGMHPFIIQDEPGSCPICGMDLTPVKQDKTESAANSTRERTVKYWVAPMDPSYISDKPGKSPMGMDLVPVYEDEAATGSIIAIDPVTQQNMGVRTAKVVRRNLHRTVKTVGVIGYEEPRQYSVNTKIDGWIEKLYVNETGVAVKKGAPLLEIYSPELVAAQEEFLLALRNRKALSESVIPEIAAGAERLLESSRKRLKYWDISSRQIAELERIGKALKTMTINAPYDGIVTSKKAYEGMYAKAGMELFQISDISRVWVYADIYEYELPWIKVGQTVQVSLPYKREPVSGKVSTIYPYVEPKTRTVKARIDLANPGLEFKPDMYVSVQFAAQTVRNVLAIPAEAVLNSGDRQTVFIALGNGKFEPREIKLGLQGKDGYVEVKQGLLGNEQVVTSAQFMLDSESTLREAIQKMLEPKKKLPDAAVSEPDGQESLDDLFNDEKPAENLDSLFK